MVLEGWGFDGLDVPAKTSVRPIEVGRAKADGPCQADFGGEDYCWNLSVFVCFMATVRCIYL